jgi:hypothetical protein
MSETIHSASVDLGFILSPGDCFGFGDSKFGFAGIVRHHSAMKLKNVWSGKRKHCFFIIVVGVFMIGATLERTIYSDISNKELKTRVMRLVNNIRELVYAHRKQDRELLAVFDKRNSADTTINERKRVREQWIRESDTAHDSFLRQYKEKYWADAILLRNEIQRRLPKNLRQPQLSGIYQYPTNHLGVEAIADNLELLAKSLPNN